MTITVNPLNYHKLGEDLPERPVPEGESEEHVPLGLGVSAGALENESSLIGGNADDGDDPSDGPPPKIYGEEMGSYRKRPLIFVPGFGASELTQLKKVFYRGRKVIDPSTGEQKRERGLKKWPPVSRDPNNGNWVRQHLQDLNDPDIVTAPTGLISNFYEELLNFLRDDLKYSETDTPQTLYTFLYDWTDSNRISGKRLAGFIAKVVKEFPWPDNTAEEDKVVDVINHSNGGLVTRWAIIKYMSPVNKTVYLASPHYGASKAYFVLHPDVPINLSDNMIKDLVAEEIWDRFIKDADEDSIKDEIKLTAQGMDSAFELMPDQFEFDKSKPPCMTEDGVLFNGWNKTYTQESASKFHGASQRKAVKAMNFKLDLGETLPGKINLVLFSNAKQTKDRINVDVTGPFYHFEGNPYDSGDKGDGTVPTTSARGPGAAINIPGVDHSGLPNVKTTHYWIAHFLSKNE
ncbi:MAG: hypothetical protein KBT53_09540 [Porticoccus sp.]|nr:hypothetical protein [Porticoccus sp.]MBQ0807287.1 hypothetical protein [Porticoccus sp.]